MTSTTKTCPAIRFAIPNAPQEKLANVDCVPNTLKITVEFEDGNYGRERGITVRFRAVETYPDSQFERFVAGGGKRDLCSFTAIPLPRHNPNRLQKVDKVIKANAETLAEMWFKGERETISPIIISVLTKAKLRT